MALSLPELVLDGGLLQTVLTPVKAHFDGMVNSLLATIHIDDIKYGVVGNNIQCNSNKVTTNGPSTLSRGDNDRQLHYSVPIKVEGQRHVYLFLQGMRHRGSMLVMTATLELKIDIGFTGVGGPVSAAGLQFAVDAKLANAQRHLQIGYGILDPIAAPIIRREWNRIVNFNEQMNAGVTLQQLRQHLPSPWKETLGNASLLQRLRLMSVELVIEPGLARIRLSVTLSN